MDEEPKRLGENPTILGAISLLAFSVVGPPWKVSNYKLEKSLPVLTCYFSPSIFSQKNNQGVRPVEDNL